MIESLYEYFSFQEKLAYQIRASGYEPENGMVNLINNLMEEYVGDLAGKGFAYYKIRHENFDGNCVLDVLEYAKENGGFEFYDLM